MVGYFHSDICTHSLGRVNLAFRFFLACRKKAKKKKFELNSDTSHTTLIYMASSFRKFIKPNPNFNLQCQIQKQQFHHPSSHFFFHVHEHT